MTIIQVIGHLRSPGEKGQTKKIRDLELRYMFLGQISRTWNPHQIIYPKTLFEASKSVKRTMMTENHGKQSRNDVSKVPVFDIVLPAISQPFLKIST